MVKPDLAPASVDRSTADTIFHGSLRRCLPAGILMFSFCIFGSVVGLAQEQQAPQQQGQGQQDQNQQAPDQDVAKAARAERARKGAYPRKSRHVYTAEDLKRDQILTPEDRALYDAKRNEQPLPGTQPTPAQDALDAQSLPPDAPLGDIARSLQRQKELMKLRRSNEFHLPSLEPPVLAAPKPSMEPLRQPLIIPLIKIEPARPPVVGPFHPPVKRSPFERPRIFAPEFVAPRALHPAPATSEVSPAAPQAPRNLAPSKPAHPAIKTPRAVVPAPELPRSVAPAPIASEVSPAAPTAPRNLAPSKPAHPAINTPRSVVPAPELPRNVAPAPIASEVSPAPPQAPRNLAPSKPAHPAIKTPRAVVPAPELPHAVAPAPIASEVSPAAPKAPHNFVPSKPAHPAIQTPRAVVPAPELPHAVAPAPATSELSPAAPKAPRNLAPATPLRPTLKAPRTVVPAPPVYRVAPATPAISVAPPVAPPNASVINAGKVVTVQPGDSLWKIAEQHLGNGLRWQELLSVNPGISDPGRIIAGSQIVLPAASAQRSAKYTVQKGDTLWAIAQSHLGRATAWSCVAKANPQVLDANFILEGQVLALPSSCPR